MKQKNRVRTEVHYYSQQLKQKLNTLHSAHIAVVEAPSGYGKTTAIQDFLKAGLSQGTPVYWFTAADEAPSAGFRRLCREIEKIDGRAGERLQKIGLPNAANIGEACDALRTIECRSKTYLVIDNFQLMQNAVRKSLFNALIEHGGEALHIIIISQMLKRDIVATIASHGVLHFIASDLRLDEGDILSYYSLAGVKVTLKQAQSIARCTEGWIIAVYLQLCAYRQTGSVSDTSGTLALMEHLIWDELTDEQQIFMLFLSPFEMVTVQQACMLNGCNKLPGYALDALGIPFIRFDSAWQQYELHSILSELLTEKRRERGADFEHECLLRAGDYCRHDKKTDKALDFYMQIGDYERIMSLDLSHLTLEHIGGTPFYEIALKIAKECPNDIKKRHPLSLLRVAWALMTVGKHKEFDILMKELHSIIEENCSEEFSLLRGEWLLISSWHHLPRLDKMTELVKQAAIAFNGTCSRVILPSAPWCFGNHCQLDVFHSTAGEADREADALEEYISLYSRLTGGHGTGADILYRTELAHFRGNLIEAEMLAYKASFLAEGKQQSIIQLGTALHLAEIAVEKSDMAGWQQAMDSMERAASMQAQNNFVLHSEVEMLRAILLNELKHQSRIPHWLKNGETSGRLLPSMEGIALFIRLCYFMHEDEFARLTGLTEAVLETLPKEAVYADTLFSFLAAIGHISMGNRARAAELLEHAAEKALADGLVFLLAVYNWLLQGMPEELIKKQYPKYLASFIEIKERFMKGFLALHDDMASEELPGNLTAREQEVAKLAAEGLRNSEIAKKLMVTENTVRFHLRTVFQKLDIDRRAKLAEKLI